ncbi:MAG: hypothetical protein Athens101428_690 [Candidatus Berkelbacteria bacterium Athens1014_28]|uniref:Uncharacterized protein n=1 Tax=Candidatus Berkelbacteria bacterium Athens1014_28 TaxID=2017145 RepID=A0A554LKH1_9BACT|nr:MAG: hypothetical protein Athens101428_690 [Candidatus Berkelbacteria bacterium Athens1014_28]
MSSSIVWLISSFHGIGSKMNYKLSLIYRHPPSSVIGGLRRAGRFSLMVLSVFISDNKSVVVFTSIFLYSLRVTKQMTKIKP